MAIYLVGSSEYPFRENSPACHIRAHEVCECLRPIFEDTQVSQDQGQSPVVRGRHCQAYVIMSDYILSPLQRTRLRVQPSTDHAGDADWELPE